jgi:hypothetical protein
LKKIYFIKSSTIIHDNFSINQLKIYLSTQSILYLFELSLTDILITEFEKFLHHLFAILLFTLVIYQPIIICCNFLLPVFVHSVYWLISETANNAYGNLVLYVYNFTLILSSCLFLKEYFWNNKNLQMNIRTALFLICLLATCLFYANMMGYFYGYNINFKRLDDLKFLKSNFYALILTFPCFSYLTSLQYFNKIKPIDLV